MAAPETSGGVPVPPSRADELLRAGDPAGALRALTDDVRARPGDGRLRVFMAQLLCVVGQWDRAVQQLDVAASLDTAAAPMREEVRNAIHCEKLRVEVFAGRRTPLIFGEPEPWLALLVEALSRQAAGEQAMADDLRTRAFGAAPESAGSLDGVPFEWLADADMRLGPVLEVFVDDRYYWVPLSRLARVTLAPPADLRDVVWLPARLQFVHGGGTDALLPARYDGSAGTGEGPLQLGRRTDWRELSSDVWAGWGQRVLSSDTGDHALLDIREIALHAPQDDSSVAPPDGAGGSADADTPRHG